MRRLLHTNGFFYDVSSNGTESVSEIYYSDDVTAVDGLLWTTAADCNDSSQATSNPYIMSWYLQTVYILAFTAMVTVAAGGNLIVVWIVLGHRRMRTVTNYFLVNLAVADTLITVLNTMFNFIYLLHSHWPFGSLYCKFNNFISNCTIAASVFTFMAIAFDRYMVIIHPLKPRIGAMTVITVICVIWVAAIAVAFPNLPVAQTHTWPCNQRTLCYLAWDNDYGDFWYNMFLFLATYMAPLIALAATYTRVGIELWGSKTIGERTAGQEESTKSKRRIVKMMIAVVVIFAICWMPTHVYYLIANIYPEILQNTWSQHTYLVIYWLAMSNAMYNPIIYCWMNARFRSGFKFILRWLPCIRWRPSDAYGFWGFTGLRSCSLTNNDQQATRCSSMMAPGGGGGNASHYNCSPIVAFPLTERNHGGRHGGSVNVCNNGHYGSGTRRSLLISGSPAGDAGSNRCSPKAADLSTSVKFHPLKSTPPSSTVVSSDRGGQHVQLVMTSSLSGPAASASSGHHQPSIAPSSTSFHYRRPQLHRYDSG